MRVSVQRCLILGLCFLFSPNVFSAYEWRPSGGQNNTLPSPYDFVYVCTTWSADSSVTFSKYPTNDTAVMRCTRPNGNYITEYLYPVVGIDGVLGCGDAGVDWSTGQCFPATQEPSECYENGQIYDPSNQQCVLQCPEGQLNGVCLEVSAQNNETCNSETSDYQGSIGFGSTKLNICASQTQCDGGSFGVVNGTPVCIADEYGPPSCPSSGALVIDEYGFVCESLNNAPEAPQVAEEPNTDTNGDGIPDEYQRANDPESVEKGLDKINVSLSTSIESLDKSNNILGKMNEQNKRMIEELDDVGDGLGSVNTHLQNLQDAMVPPEGGFNPDGFGGLVPTFEETGANFIAAINGMSQVQALTDFVSIGSNNTCPVYTIPATPVSQPIVLDIHCAVFEEYRSTFAAIFLFFWIGLSLFIFFRA